MKTIELTSREKGCANYMVERNKVALNRISPDCVAPLIAIRQACKKTAEAIGGTELLSEKPLTNDEWYKITKWIYQAFFT